VNHPRAATEPSTTNGTPSLGDAEDVLRSRDCLLRRSGRVLYGGERRGQCHVEAGIGYRTTPANRFAAGTISGGIPGIQWFD